MPLVTVTANRSHKALADYKALKQLGQLLRVFVATALTCDDVGGKLTEDDVEVDLKDRDLRRNIGGEQYDLRIIVFANDFPSRRANLEARCEQLRFLIRNQHALRDVKGFVWILLFPAAFAEL